MAEFDSDRDKSGGGGVEDSNESILYGLTNPVLPLSLPVPNTMLLLGHAFFQMKKSRSSKVSS